MSTPRQNSSRPSPDNSPPGGLLQRACACGNRTATGGECSGCGKKRLQRRSRGKAKVNEVPEIVNEVLRSSGQPLDIETRAFMEPHFGYDFSQVRLHTDAQSAASAQAVNALAYTVGQDIVFGAGRYAPETSAGQQLLAHELTHTIQQGTTGQRFAGKLEIGDESDSAERQADSVAQAITNGAKVPPFTPINGSFIQRAPADRSSFMPRHSSTLPYREAKELMDCIRIMGQSNRDYCQEEVLGKEGVLGEPAAPAATSATSGLSEEMLKQIARVLHEALTGLNTDEAAIYSSFAGRTQEQVDAIARVYQQMYSVDLLGKLRRELDDAEMKHLAIFSPTAVPGEAGSEQQTAAFADMVAAQLHKAMKGLGTDEESIYAALTGRTKDELVAIKEAYTRLTKRDLAADIEDEMSGAELTRALALLNQGMLLPEDEIYLAVKGLGTDEDTLLRVLETVKGDRAKITDLIDKFARKGYGNLLEWINEELSGSDLDKALEALHGETPSVACSVSQREKALEAISLAAAMAQNANNRANTDLVSNKLSGAVKNALQTYFNPGNAPNAVNLGLLRQVRDAFDQTRTDILSFSNVVCVTQNDGHCVTKPDCSSFVAAWTPTSAGGTVNICPAFYSCDDDRATSMLHEFFHHMGIRDRGIYYGQAGYSALTPIGDGSVNDSLSKADAFAHFAKELF